MSEIAISCLEELTNAFTPTCGGVFNAEMDYNLWSLCDKYVESDVDPLKLRTPPLDIVPSSGGNFFSNYP